MRMESGVQRRTRAGEALAGATLESDVMMHAPVPGKSSAHLTLWLPPRRGLPRPNLTIGVAGSCKGIIQARMLVLDGLSQPQQSMSLPAVGPFASIAMPSGISAQQPLRAARYLEIATALSLAC
jgi:hypothetical protein